jgi:hypothetical protein
MTRVARALSASASGAEASGLCLPRSILPLMFGSSLAEALP